MTHTRKPGLPQGQVAIVEIAAPDRTVLMIEVNLDGKTLTITDEPNGKPIPDEIRTLAIQLIAAVKGSFNG